nr:hypothetical protein [Tanacetum cinerariifolium]
MLLTKALESGVYLDPKQLAFLADNGDTVIPAQASQEISSPAAFQTYDLDAFDFDCDDEPSAKAVLVENLFSYDLDVLLDVLFHDTNIENDISYQRMFKLDLEPLAPRVLNNRDSHIDYIKHSWEHADTLWEIVKHARALRPLDSDLDSACKIV